MSEWPKIPSDDPTKRWTIEHYNSGLRHFYIYPGQPELYSSSGWHGVPTRALTYRGAIKMANRRWGKTGVYIGSTVRPYP